MHVPNLQLLRVKDRSQNTYDEEDWHTKQTYTKIRMYTIYSHYSRLFATGLDPAGPEFEHRDVTAELNPANADLVDVIHTDGNRWFNFNLGMMRTVGHVDFYPNGGLMQRACQLQSKELDLTRYLVRGC